MSNTTINGNSASCLLTSLGDYGGGLYVAGGTVTLTNCAVDSNTTNAQVTYGGGLYVAGGSVTLSNTTVGSNSAEYGGGLYVAGGTVTLANDTVESNWADSEGGGLCITGGTVTLTNDTIESNLATDSGFSSGPFAGYGGGILMVAGAAVSLDSFTVANTINNTDSTGTNGSTANSAIAWDGSYIPAPAAGQPPIVLNAASADPSPVTGTTTNLSVLGADAAGFASLTYTWDVTSSPSGASTPTFSSNGSNASQNTTATFYRAGTYTFQVTITDPSGLTAVSSVTVTVVQTVSGISITPGNVTVADGAKQQFTATAIDQFGQAMPSQPTFSWQVLSSSGGTVSSSSGGTISSTGLYTAPKHGTGSFDVDVSAEFPGEGISTYVIVTLVA